MFTLFDKIERKVLRKHNVLKEKERARLKVEVE